MTEAEPEQAQPIVVDPTSWTGDTGPPVDDLPAVRAEAAQKTRLRQLIQTTVILVVVDITVVAALLVSAPAQYARHGILPAGFRIALAILLASPLPWIIERVWQYTKGSAAEIDEKRDRRWRFYRARARRPGSADDPPLQRSDQQ
jgi:hypothetical protein